MEQKRLTAFETTTEKPTTMDLLFQVWSLFLWSKWLNWNFPDSHACQKPCYVRRWYHPRSVSKSEKHRSGQARKRWLQFCLTPPENARMSTLKRDGVSNKEWPSSNHWFLGDMLVFRGVKGTCYLSIFRGPIFPCNFRFLWWTPGVIVDIVAFVR